MVDLWFMVYKPPKAHLVNWLAGTPKQDDQNLGGDLADHSKMRTNWGSLDEHTLVD